MAPRRPPTPPSHRSNRTRPDPAPPTQLPGHLRASPSPTVPRTPPPPPRLAPQLALHDPLPIPAAPPTRARRETIPGADDPGERPALPLLPCLPASPVPQPPPARAPASATARRPLPLQPQLLASIPQARAPLAPFGRPPIARISVPTAPTTRGRPSSAILDSGWCTGLLGNQSRRGGTMGHLSLITMSAVIIGAVAYMPHGKEPFLTDALLREVVDRMGKDLADAADAYLDFPDTGARWVLPRDTLLTKDTHATLELGFLLTLLPSLGSLLPGRAVKDLEADDQQFPMDYDRLAELANPNPSLRDQEYLQHSSLWGHQYMTGGAGEGKQHLKPDGTVQNQKEVKTDAALPAYCNPPNPCPVGYGAEDGCLERFENTAVFSRDFQVRLQSASPGENVAHLRNDHFEVMVVTNAYNCQITAVID
ncbi:Uncharacterized protein GBIM_07177 [Gryllus bimaculatus]|nr:Uncharacterized protein GBIM_07177 [Gryllus bimaculatus]